MQNKQINSCTSGIRTPGGFMNNQQLSDQSSPQGLLQVSSQQNVEVSKAQAEQTIRQDEIQSAVQATEAPVVPQQTTFSSKPSTPKMSQTVTPKDRFPQLKQTLATHHSPTVTSSVNQSGITGLQQSTTSLASPGELSVVTGLQQIPTNLSSQGVQPMVTGLQQSTAHLATKNMVYIQSSQLQGTPTGLTSSLQTVQATGIQLEAKKEKTSILMHHQIASQTSATGCSQPHVLTTGLNVVQASPRVPHSIRHASVRPKQTVSYFKGEEKPAETLVSIPSAASQRQYGHMAQLPSGNYVIVQQSVNSAPTARSPNSFLEHGVQQCVASTVTVDSISQTLSQKSVQPANPYVACQPEKSPSPQTTQVAITDAIQHFVCSSKNPGIVHMRQKVNAFVGQAPGAPGNVTIIGNSTGHVSNLVAQQSLFGVKTNIQGKEEIRNKGNLKLEVAGNIQSGAIYSVPQEYNSVQRMVVRQDIAKQLPSVGIQSNLNQTSEKCMSEYATSSENKNVSQLLADQKILADRSKKTIENVRIQTQNNSKQNTFVVNKVKSGSLNLPDMNIIPATSMHVSQAKSASDAHMVQTLASTSQDKKLTIQTVVGDSNESIPERVQTGLLETDGSASNESQHNSTTGTPKGTPSSNPNSVDERNHITATSVSLPKRTQAKIVDYDKFMQAIDRGVKLGDMPSTPANRQIDGNRYVMIYQAGNVIEAVRNGDHFSVLQGSCLTQRIAASKKYSDPTGSLIISGKPVEQTLSEQKSMEKGAVETETVRGGGRLVTMNRGRGKFRGSGRGGGQTRPAGANFVTTESRTAGETLREQQQQQVMKRRSLHTEGNMHDDGIIENGEVQKPAREKRPTKTGIYAVCPHCGTCSQDYDFCDSCQKSLPLDVKMHDEKTDMPSRLNLQQFVNPQAAPNPSLQISKQTVQKVVSKMDSKTIYGKKNQEGGMIHSSDPVCKVRTRTPNQRKYTRKKAKQEMVILSSDDEEEAARRKKMKLVGTEYDSKNVELFYSKNNIIGKNGQQGTAAKSPANIKTYSRVTKQVTTESTKQNREHMDNEYGKPSTSNNSIVPMKPSPSESSSPPPPSLSPQPLPQTTNQERHLKLPLRQVHIGSLVLTAADSLMVSAHGLLFKLQFGNVPVELEIRARDLEKVTCGLEGDTPSIILHGTPQLGERFRARFQLKHNGPYFDPHGTVEKVKKITFIMPPVGPKAEALVTEVFTTMQKNNADVLHIPFLHMVDDQELKKQLIQYEVLVRRKPAAISQPETNGEDEEEMSRSPSPVPRTFQGEVIKMFIYPPPPATGGITVSNEDYFCLNEGEFLNDVIIDFYLKWLYLNKLSPENKANTHIFSSFFYRRLTQREPRSMHSPDELRLPLPERRHNRVKTWTRHVDLFEKDFIIVPINESSHWYLAIICWPGLRQPANVEYRVSQEVPVSSLSEEERKQHDQESVPASAEIQEEAMDTTETEDGSDKSAKPKKDSVTRVTSFVALRQSCILIFDSLSGGQRNSVIKMLREYLDIEWKTKKVTTKGQRTFDKETIKGCNVKCPQQANFSDCGVFVLQYVESFFENPIASYTVPMHLENWFPVEVVLRKRDELKALILQLKNQLNKDLKVPDIDEESQKPKKEEDT